LSTAVKIALQGKVAMWRNSSC